MASKSKTLTYSEKLRDPRWQKMRLLIMERDGFTCRHCRSAEKTLNVHHHFYTKGAMPWEYETDDLITLCEDCHRGLEARLRSVSRFFGSSKSNINALEWFIPMAQARHGDRLFEMFHFLSEFMESLMRMNMGFVDMEDSDYTPSSAVDDACAESSSLALALVGQITHLHQLQQSGWRIELHDAIKANNHPKGGAK